MDSRWLDLLREQQAAGFPDLAGTRLSLRVPISDRLVTRIISENLPASSRLRHFEVKAEAGNRIKVVVQLARPSFLPTLTIPLDIVAQPELPSSPILTLRVSSSPSVMGFAGSVLRLLDSLPDGIAVDRHEVRIDLRLLAARYKIAEWFEYLDLMELTTEDARVILSLDAVLPPPAL